MLIDRLFQCRLQQQVVRHPAGDVARHERLGAAKDACQRVVVIHRDRVKFMFMATHTTERHAEECATDGDNLLIDHLHPQQFLVLQLVVVRTQRQEAGGDELLIALFATRGRQQVTRNLLTNELIERLVFVEGTDHIVTKSPRILEHQTPPTAAALREARHIQPVSSPCLAKLR